MFRRCVRFSAAAVLFGSALQLLLVQHSFWWFIYDDEFVPTDIGAPGRGVVFTRGGSFLLCDHYGVAQSNLLFYLVWFGFSFSLLHRPCSGVASNNNNNKRPLTPKSMPPAGDEHAKLKT